MFGKIFDKRLNGGVKCPEHDARLARPDWLSIDEPALPEHVRRFFAERHPVKKRSSVPV